MTKLEGRMTNPARSPKAVRAALLLAALGLAAANAQSYTSGVILERAGQFERALEEYRLVLSKSPQERPAYEGFARLAKQLGQLDTLVAVSRRLGRQFPEVSDYSFGLVGGLLAMKRTADARAEARRAAERWPDRLAQLAEVFAGHEDFAQAIEYYEQARKRGGDAFSIADRLLDLRLAAGQPGPAAREMVSVLNSSPHLFDRYRQKLSALAVRGGAAVTGELEKVQDQRVRGRALAVVYLAIKKDAEAVRVLKPVLTVQEFYQFARDCEAQGALRAALAVYQEQKAHVDAARVLRLMGRVREAQAELVMDGGAAAQFELGELYRDQRDYGAAAETYQRFLSRQPGHEPAGFGLASALLGLGRTEPARAAARKTGTLSDRLLLIVARTFFYEGQFDSSGVYVAELVRRFPQSSLANDGLELAAMTGSGDRARELAGLLLAYETGAVDSGKVKALSEGNDPVAEQACFLLARSLRREHRPKDALAVLDRYRQRFGSSALAPRARLEQAVLYLDDLKDEGKYRETLEQLIIEYPGSAYVPVARSLLDATARPLTPEGIR
ncbi:tetratricopeptide repeat protein [candidate division WOR-3 bacterium]|uniref:Tetratricopeptide repeat protein n=1 Tax=candidate division WOR-3 bacterium TaxID=2052148 RepID=A0A938BPH7_UNCW3|nr:tetratricopeptide repeat protein [candidate division WOR-3 bacterium]